jgi:hypothetical protein
MRFAKLSKREFAVVYNDLWSLRTPENNAWLTFPPFSVRVPESDWEDDNVPDHQSSCRIETLGGVTRRANLGDTEGAPWKPCG